MKKVKVIEFQRYRDGGTIEYRDEHNRAYVVPASILNDKRIYREIPERYFEHKGKYYPRSESYLNDLSLVGIELEIVEKL